MALPAPVQQPGVQYAPKKEHVQLGTIGTSLAAQVQAWPLSAAASLLEPYLQHERQLPDLDVVAASRIVENHCTPNLQETRVYAPFKVSKSSIPSVLLGSLDSAKFGYLNALDTVWATTDRTWFWNLKNGDLKEFEIEGTDKNIVNVACVAPSPQVFSDEVKHLLVVSTSESMRLFAVSSDESFFDTGLEIPLTGLGVPQVSGAGGRIFFSCSRTGTAIWEFKYREKETWFQSRVERICHGEYGGIFGGLFGKKGSDDPNVERVKSLEVDESVNNIYVLTTKSEIHVYSFDPKGSNFTLTTSFNLSRIRSALALSGHKDPVTALVLLSSVPLTASKFIRCVAVTSSGARIYFRTKDSYLNRGFAPRGNIDVAYVQNLDSDLAVRHAKVGSGKVTITEANKKVKNEQDGTTTLSGGHRVMAASIDYARVSYRADINQPIPFVELSGWVSLDSKPILIISSEERSIIGSPQSDLVLTESSLYTLVRRPFSDRLEYADISLSIAQIYGTTQLCSSALQVASQTADVTVRDNAIQSLFRFGGLPMFLREESRFLGHASIRLSPLLDGFAFYMARLLIPVWSEKILSGSSMKRGVNDKVLQNIYSQLDGLVKFLDRNRSFSEGLSERHPSTMPNNAASSSTFLGSSFNSSDDAALLSQGENKAVQALGRLARSCQEGIAFLRVVLATNYDTKQLLSYFDKSLMGRFQQLTFGEFFTEAKNSNVARELVNSLINYVLNRGETVETVASVIQDRCPSYCSTGDVLEYKALEYIHRAKKSYKKKQVDTASLAKSVSLIRKAASTIQLDTLKDVVDDYVQLNYFQGVVHVCLAVGGEQDPANIAVGYLRHKDSQSRNSHPEHSAKRRAVEAIPTADPSANEDTATALSLSSSALPVGIPAATSSTAVVAGGSKTPVVVSEGELKYRAKMAVFNLIFTELLDKHPALADVGTHDPAHDAMLKSNDEVWHFALYDWYLGHNRQNQIAQLDTPYVATYLQQGASGDLRVANLLWKWHQRHGDLLAAADVLLGLARGPLVKSLAQRVEFLSRAMGYCRSQPLQSQNAVRMMTMVRAYLGLALLQTEIYTKLETLQQNSPHLTRMPDISDLNNKIYTVSELYNNWAEPNGLYDVCFAIFEFADFRDPVEIHQCWNNLFTKARLEDTRDSTVHYTHISSLVSQLGSKYKTVPTIFSVKELIPLLEQYAVDYTRSSPPGWIVDTFLSIGIERAALEEIYASLLANQELEGVYAQHANTSLNYLKGY